MRTLAASILLLLLTACAGTAARTNTLLPALQTVWPPIKAAAEREAHAVRSSAPGLVAIAGADDAVLSGDPISIAAANWPVVDGLAAGDTTRRQAAGAIGPGVAASLRERLAQFQSARETYTRTSR